MREATQFSVFLVNKPGVLAQVATALAKAKVNVTALTLVDSSEHGVLRLVCEEPELARKALARTHDRFTETEVLAMELTNEPGAFAQAAQKLADAHINISYAYATGGAPGGRSTAIFKVADLRKALRVLAPPKGSRKDRPTTVKSSPRRRRG
ncbi:MAG TPA: ACT domain-containing protein [Phycisphaerae bacterium]|nr:ACT domain-containing protein [Phycisphaerae bacterium]